MKYACLVQLFLMLLCPIIHAQSAEQAELESILEQANNFFREGMEASTTDSWKSKKLYEKAASYYERIVSDGNIKNGKVYYNIANSYFKMGDIGRAILNYLRAEQYMPDDKNLIQNLAYARSRRLDKVEEKDETMLIKIIFFWHYELSSSLRLIIFTVFFLTAWILAILRLFFRQGLINFFLITAAVITLLFLGSLVMEFSSSGENSGVILATEVVAHKGDSDTYEKSFQEPLHAGTEFVLVEERRGWYNIELRDGRNCWVPVKDAGLVK